MIDENILMKALLIISGIWVVLFLLLAKNLRRTSLIIIILLMSIASLALSGIELYYVSINDLWGDWFSCFFFCPNFFETILGVLLLGIVLVIQIAGVLLGLKYIGNDKINLPFGVLCWVVSITIGVIINIFSSRIIFELSSYGPLLIPIILYTLFIIGKFFIKGHILTGCITGIYYFINGFAIFVTGLYFCSVFIGIFVIFIMIALLLGAISGSMNSKNERGITILDEHGIRHNLQRYDDSNFKDENGRYWHRSNGGFKTDE